MKTDRIASYIIIGFYVLLIIFGVISLFTPGWLVKIAEPGRKTEANTFIEEANKLMYQGDFKTAAEIYTKSLEIDKENRNVYGNLAIAYMKLGYFDLAEKNLKEIERLNSGLDSLEFFMFYLSHADLEKAKAYSFIEKGLEGKENMEKALFFYKKAMNLMPFNINVAYKYSYMAMQLNKDSVAIKGFESALEKAARTETVFYADIYDEFLNAVANKLNEDAEALEQIIHSGKAVDINKYDILSLKLNVINVDEMALAYASLGELLYRNKNIERAGIAFENCLKIRPGLYQDIEKIKEKYK